MLLIIIVTAKSLLGLIKNRKLPLITRGNEIWIKEKGYKGYINVLWFKDSTRIKSLKFVFSLTCRVFPYYSSRCIIGSQNCNIILAWSLAFRPPFPCRTAIADSGTAPLVRVRPLGQIEFPTVPAILIVIRPRLATLVLDMFYTIYLFHGA